MEDSIKPHLPLIHAISVFLLLFGILVVIALRYDFSSIPNPGTVLFLLAAMCCFLVAKITYTESHENLFDKHSSATPEVLDLSAKTYTEIFTNSPVPYVVIDDTGAVKFFNTAAVRLFGLSPARVQLLNVFEYVTTEQADHLGYIIDKFHNGISANNELVSVKRGDNKEAWALLSLFSYVNEFGQRSGLLTLVDITRQKKAEDAKSEFVSLASHQLRTPIAGMKWSAELLEMDDAAGTLSSKQHEYIDRLIDSINRLALLVDDFLRVSRFDLGTFTPEYERISVVTLCNEVIEDMKVRAHQKDIEIVTSFDESLHSVITDPNLARMILSNLISNAVKYTKPGGVVTVDCSVNNNRLEIKVVDTGIGIPATDKQYIFSKLFRSSNAIRGGVEGTGLGLYIVRSAVEVLKGKISFTSEENVGTTFTVTLPVSFN